MPTQHYSKQDRTPHIRFYVSRPDGQTWEDLSDYLSFAEVELGQIKRFGATAGVDQVVRQATFVLSHTRQMMPVWSRSLSAPPERVVGQDTEVIGTSGTSGTALINRLFGVEHRWAGEGSFHPLDRRSPWNYWSNQYNPLLFSRRECILEVAFTPPGELPETEDWFRLFEGIIGDSIRNKGAGAVEFTCRDRAKLLMDSYIDAKRTYGSDAGEPAEDVVAQILVDNEWSSIAGDLWVPSSPGFKIYPYEVDFQSPWDAIQQVSTPIGWFLGFRFNPSEGKFVLTFMEPPRTKASETADFVLSARDEIIVQNLDISDVDIRNIVEVTFRNAATGQLDTVVVQDEASIAMYGKRRMAIGEKDTVHIRTTEDATQFALRVLFDLSSLRGTTRIESRMLPSMDLFSGVLVDDERLSSTQDFYGVESVRHVLDMTGQEHKYRTEIVASSKVIGGHARWLQMETRRGASMPLAPEAAIGGGRLMPKPEGVTARGTISGVAIDVPVPPVNANRWAETEIHLSTTDGFIPSSATKADGGKKTHFELTDDGSNALTPGVRYYARCGYKDVRGDVGVYSDQVSAVARRADSADVEEGVVGFRLNGYDAFAEAFLPSELFTLPAGINEFDLIVVDGEFHLVYTKRTNRATPVNVLSAEDSSFEGNTLGNWTNGGGTTSLAASTDRASDGTHSVKATYSSSPLLMALPFSGSTNTRYAVSGEVYIPDGWDGGDIHWDDDATFGGATSVARVDADGGATGRWQRFYRIYDLTSDATGAWTIRTTSAATSGKTLYFDKLMVTALDEETVPPPWVLGSVQTHTSHYRSASTIAGLADATDTEIVGVGLYPSLQFVEGVWHLWAWDSNSLTTKHYTAESPTGTWTEQGSLPVNKADIHVRRNPKDGLWYAGYKELAAGGDNRKAGVLRAESPYGPWTDLGYVFDNIGRAAWHASEEADAAIWFYGQRAYLAFAAWDAAQSMQRCAIAELDSDMKAVAPPLCVVEALESWQTRNNSPRVFNPVFLEHDGKMRIYYAHNPSGDDVETGWSYAEVRQPIGELRRVWSITKPDFRSAFDLAARIGFTIHGDAQGQPDGILMTSADSGAYGYTNVRNLNDFTIVIECTFSVLDPDQEFTRIFSLNRRDDSTGLSIGFWARYHGATGEDKDALTAANILTGGTGSGGFGGFVAAHCVDDNLVSNAWHTDASSPGDYLRIDVGSGNTREYTKCRVYVQAAGYAGQYTIAYSDDNVSWSNAKTGWTPNSAGWNETSWASVGSHRYWRLELENTPGAGPYINELEMYVAAASEFRLYAECRGDDSDKNLDLEGTTQLVVGRRYRFAMRRLGDDVVLYVNHAQEDTGTQGDTFTNCEQWKVGNRLSDESAAGQQMLGTVHVVEVINEALPLRSL